MTMSYTVTSNTGLTVTESVTEVCEAGQLQKVKQIVKHLRKTKRTGWHSPTKLASKPGVPGATRTRDPLLRRQLLYPTELQGHTLRLPCLILASL
jgi:hypothetical protein